MCNKLNFYPHIEDGGLNGRLSSSTTPARNCDGPDPLDNHNLWPGREVLGICSHLAANVEATGSQCKQGGASMNCETRQEVDKIRADG